MFKYVVIPSPYFLVFGLNTAKYGPEITPYLDTFHAVTVFRNRYFEAALSLPLLVQSSNGGT